MQKLFSTLLLLFVFGFISCQNPADRAESQTTNNKRSLMGTTYNKSEEEWKKTLSPEQFEILRKKGTERPGTGKYNLHFEKGIYKCAGCGAELFSNEQKFDSHCGWPSFDNELGGGDRIRKVKDYSFGMARTEIVCARCGGHLGHIFDDGPTATGQRYCVNSLSLDFSPEEEDKK
jgi:methionine-R-sulfoxide reductase